MNKVLISAIISVAASSFTVTANAAVIFFSNDMPGFAAAMSGKALVGIEDFEESTLAPASFSVIDDPLSQSTTAPPFPTGLTQPITVQSNVGGGNPVTTNPRGTGGLAVFSAGIFSIQDDIVFAGEFADSLDWLFDASSQISGIGFNTEAGNVGDAEIRVFDVNNALLGMTTIATDHLGTNFLGVQTTGGDLIGRINIYAKRLGVTDLAEGGDNIRLYSTSVPEPTSISLLFIGLAGLNAARARKKKQKAAI